VLPYTYGCTAVMQKQSWNVNAWGTNGPQDAVHDAGHDCKVQSNSSLQMLITAVKIYKTIQLFGDSAVSHRDLSNYVG
jgi:hypothetical protein